MDKEKEIEEMAKELHCATSESFISCRKIARILVERRGYGNVEQAVKEFADKVKEINISVNLPNGIWSTEEEIDDMVNDIFSQVCKGIDNLIAELYGAGDNKE